MTGVRPTLETEASPGSDDLARYAAYFHELDAWTEYWDIYHPETEGRFYFGTLNAPGLLTQIVPRHTTPAVFNAWKRRALGTDRDRQFEDCLADTELSAAITELDELVSRIVVRHFGDAVDHADYLHAMHLFATDSLPSASARLARVPAGDPRRRTAGRHTIDADMMWFVWSLQLECAHLISPEHDDSHSRALLLAGVAAGCSANFASRRHRRTRPEYGDDETSRLLLLERGLRWAGNIDAAAAEVHALYRIREWGHE